MTNEDLKMLGRITTTDEAGRHFTEVYPDEWLERMEKEGYIEIYRPVHEPTGIEYGQEEWQVEVTQKGIKIGETLSWGE